MTFCALYFVFYNLLLLFILLHFNVVCTFDIRYQVLLTYLLLVQLIPAIATDCFINDRFSGHLVQSVGCVVSVCLDDNFRSKWRIYLTR